MGDTKSMARMVEKYPFLDEYLRGSVVEISSIEERALTQRTLEKVCTDIGFLDSVDTRFLSFFSAVRNGRVYELGYDQNRNNARIFPFPRIHEELDRLMIRADFLVERYYRCKIYENGSSSAKVEIRVYAKPEQTVG